MTAMNPKIVSLLASSTEMVCALGFQKNLVARSHECDFPQGVESLPICTEPRFSIEGTSLEIDQRVKSILQDALSPYRVDPETLRDLQPDLIVTQTQCEVCAVSIGDVHAALEGAIGKRPDIVSLAAESLAGIWDDINGLAKALGVEHGGEQLVTALRNRMEAISDLANRQQKKPSVCCVEWIEPLMAAGNWVPELVKMAGGENTHGEAGKHSPYFSWEDLVNTDPDLIAIFPCGYDIEQTKENMHFLTDRPEWNALTAVKNNRAYIADGNQYFNRPGPRIVESLEILAEIIHPGVFSFRHSEACLKMTGPISR